LGINNRDSHHEFPELFRPSQVFWYMVSDARADFAMLCSLLFLISADGGAWSLDPRRRPENTQGEIS